MTLTRAQRKALPKARLISIRYIPKTWNRFTATFRNANAWTIYIGCFCIGIRAPWLEGPARALYPHLFGIPEAQRHCFAASDGECGWQGCPQIRDNEPQNSGRHCPYDHWCRYCGKDQKECAC